jgi:hypothetical protein
MKRTYIATTSEAKALHDGTQTAIIVKMRVQPKMMLHNTPVTDTGSKVMFWAQTADSERKLISAPYAIGQEVVVREAWLYRHKHDKYYHKADYPDFEPYAHQGWQSPATMPVSAARTRFRIVSCEAVRVKDLEEKQVLALGGWEYKSLPYHKSTILSLKHLIAVPKLDQSAWGNNDYVFYYKIEKI